MKYYPIQFFCHSCSSLISLSKHEHRKLTNQLFQNPVKKKERNQVELPKSSPEKNETSLKFEKRDLFLHKLFVIACKWRQILYSEMKGSLILSTRWAWKLHSDRILEKTKLCYVVFLFYKHSLLHIYVLAKSNLDTSYGVCFSFSLRSIRVSCSNNLLMKLQSDFFSFSSQKPFRLLC